MFHVITWFLVVIGGLQFALAAINIDLLHQVFGGSHHVLISVMIGLAVLYHGIPALRSHLSKL